MRASRVHEIRIRSITNRGNKTVSNQSAISQLSVSSQSAVGKHISKHKPFKGDEQHGRVAIGNIVHLAQPLTQSEAVRVAEDTKQENRRTMNRYDG